MPAIADTERDNDKPDGKDEDDCRRARVALPRASRSEGSGQQDANRAGIENAQVARRPHSWRTGVWLRQQHMHPEEDERKTN